MTENRDVVLDLRGLICPEPVLRAKKCLDSSAVRKLQAIVDDEVNVQNLSRLARSLRVQFSYQPEGEHFNVTLERAAQMEGPASKQSPLKSVDSTRAKEKVESPSANSGMKDSAVGTVIFISRDSLGEGDRDFSQQLLNLFLQSYYEAGHRPRAILMANTGVKLMQPDSQFAKVLHDFREAGCEVLACGLCVDYYGLKEVVPKDQITNMFAICEYLAAADKVLTP
jgi:selenium metabolism protein YedF